MPELTCAARRVGDQESRTEEYELRFSVGDGRGHVVQVKYQAARAFEFFAADAAATETARAALLANDPDLPPPTDEALAKFSWRALQSAKYEGGETRTSSLEL